MIQSLVAVFFCLRCKSAEVASIVIEKIIDNPQWFLQVRVVPFSIDRHHGYQGAKLVTLDSGEGLPIASPDRSSRREG